MRILLFICIFLVSGSGSYGQTFLDTDTGELLVIDSYEKITHNKDNQSNPIIYYANHNALYIPLTIKKYKQIHIDPDEMYKRIELWVTFPNDRAKIYRLELTIACGMNILCHNPDSSKQIFNWVSDNSQPKGTVVEHLSKYWSGDFCSEKGDKISIDLTTKHFKASYYSHEKANLVPLQLSDFNPKGLSFTLTYPDKPQMKYTCKITNVFNGLASFDFYQSNGQKHEYGKANCPGDEH